MQMMQTIRQYEQGGELVVESVPVPQPGPGEVLIKMIASPINPSDLALLHGDYLKRNYPFTPGLEGSGLVIKAGAGLLPRLRIGKRVACSPNPESDGTWAQYMKTSALRSIPVPKKISYEQGATMIVNPMTAMAFLHLAKEGNHHSLVNNAAASSLGKMLLRLTIHHGIPLINIVRKEQHVVELKKLGAAHVLNSSSTSFESELQKLSHDLKATLFLDAVTGEQSGILLRNAPPGSRLVVYARLSSDRMILDPGYLVKEEKDMSGFQLNNWLKSKNTLFKLRFVNQVKRHLSGSLSTHVQRRMPMEEVEQAVLLYKENMSMGKIILNIGES